MVAAPSQSSPVTQYAERARSRGISPVIGVILLVAIAVVLAASIGFVLFSLSDLQDAPPQAVFETEVDEEQGEALLTVQSGEQIEREALTATGGTIAEAPEVLRAGSTVLIDLEEDAEQLQLLHQQGDQSSILTETDRKPFINVTVRDNPPIPGVSVAAERAETGDIVAEGQTDENGIVRLPVDDPEQAYNIAVEFDEPVTSDGEEITAVEGVETTTPDELEITTEDIADADEELDETDVDPGTISRESVETDISFGTLNDRISGDGINENAKTSIDDAVEIENTGEIPASKDVSLINDDSDDVIDTKEEAFTVEPGDTKELDVTFDHTEGDTDSLKLASSDTTIEFENIDLEGLRISIGEEESAKIEVAGDAGAV